MRVLLNHGVFRIGSSSSHVSFIVEYAYRLYGCSVFLIVVCVVSYFFAFTVLSIKECWTRAVSVSRSIYIVDCIQTLFSGLSPVCVLLNHSIHVWSWICAYITLVIEDSDTFNRLIGRIERVGIIGYFLTLISWLAIVLKAVEGYGFKICFVIRGRTLSSSPVGIYLAG